MTQKICRKNDIFFCHFPTYYFTIYNVEKEDLKKYTVGSEEVTGFGTTWKKPMITETSGGGSTERFYVMALKDFDNQTHTWYANAYKKLDTTKGVAREVNDFKEGKANTKYWIDVNEGKENASFQDESKYGALEDNDIWKLLNENLNEYGREWFVPSKSEWSAFGDMCNTFMEFTLDVWSYYPYDLSDAYWSSSQYNSDGGYYLFFGSRRHTRRQQLGVH